MSLPHDPFGPRDSSEDGRESGATIVTWSADGSALRAEECARAGIEAVAGLVIFADIFGTNQFPDAHFCTCAELHHSMTGSGGNFDDHIAVDFRSVEIKNGIYPLVGRESVRMVMQPLSDGRVTARWDAINPTSNPAPDPAANPADPDRSRDEGGFVDLQETRARVCSPLNLGEMPEQQEEDAVIPSFLLLKDPGVGWQIWRRFTRIAGVDGSPVSSAFREETYAMVYPVLSPDMNWSFRVYDLPDGRIRWEVNSDKR